MTVSVYLYFALLFGLAGVFMLGCCVVQTYARWLARHRFEVGEWVELRCNGRRMRGRITAVISTSRHRRLFVLRGELGWPLGTHGRWRLHRLAEQPTKESKMVHRNAQDYNK